MSKIALINMNHICQDITIAAVGTVLSLFGMKANLVQAAIITSDFDVKITSGPLIGQTFSGWVSYDNSDDSNRPYFTANDIEFTFNGVTFTKPDPILDPFSVVIDREGLTVALNYTIIDQTSNNAFRFTPYLNFFPTGTGTFIYGNPVSGGFHVIGVGDTSFYSRIPPTPVPPTTTYTFKVEGFSGGGTLSGTFDGIDLNHDGYLAGGRRVNGIEVFEITNFIAEFYGDDLVPNLTLKQDELSFENGWRFLDNETLDLHFFDIVGAEKFLNGSGIGMVIGSTETRESFVSPGKVTATVVPKPTSVPEPPSTLGLLALGALGTSLLLKQKTANK